ncbi:MAG: RNA polymerase factor sigma-54 [Candidatus Cloacimonetes bacterium]|nr:RNA polymerase factor sigma-54 [Candidatus Cloacimonadota bacterium]
MARIQQILSVRQEQRLELRPKLLQSLHLLSLPILELEIHLKQELVTNPLLEMTEEDGEAAPEETTEPEPEQEAVDAADEELTKTLEEARELSEILDQWNEYHYEERSHSPSAGSDTAPEQLLRMKENKKEAFLMQLDRYKLSSDESDFAEELIDTANEHGYLPDGFDIDALADEYGVSPERAHELHRIILHLDPAGITARDISECLLAQLNVEQNDNELLQGIIREDFDDLIHRRYQQIATKWHTTHEAVLECKAAIGVLDPKPGLRLVANEVAYMVPDVIIKKIDGEFELIINDSASPNIRLSRRYRNIINSVRQNREALTYVRGKINSAKFLIKSMYLRNRTLERVTRCIIDHQRQFFYQETGVLEPLTYSVIAAELQVNESTISRAVKTKYADTPFGVMCLKDFFTSTAGKDKNYEAVSRQMVERHIREMVDQEAPSSPLSDQDIMGILKERGISVSRRVIAKYRRGLGILNSRLRRKE